MRFLISYVVKRLLKSLPKWFMSTFIVILGSYSAELHAQRYYGPLAQKIDDRFRYYALHLPVDVQYRQQIPLVLFLHGGGGSAKQAERTYGWVEKARAAGFAVAFPEGVENSGLLGMRTWNAGSCCNYAVRNAIDDVGFIKALLSEIERNYPQLDTRQVYVTGMSNGAMMAYRLACELPERIRAIAPVAGSMGYEGPCAAQGVSLLHIHSKLDEHVPFAGGEGVAGNNFPPAINGIKQWQELNNCIGEEKNRLSAQLSLIHYRHCRSGAGVQLYITHDGGHSWPGARQRRLRGDPVSDALAATDVIWDFFNGRERRD